MAEALTSPQQGHRISVFRIAVPQFNQQSVADGYMSQSQTATSWFILIVYLETLLIYITFRVFRVGEKDNS